MYGVANDEWSVTVAHHVDGRRTYAMPDGQEAQRLVEYRAAFAEVERGKAVSAEAARRVQERIAQLPAMAPRARLHLTVEWVAEAKRLAAAAEHRIATITEAAERRTAAQAALTALAAQERAAYQTWIRADSEADRPPSTTAEHDRLRGVGREAEIDFGIRG